MYTTPKITAITVNAELSSVGISEFINSLKSLITAIKNENGY